MTNLLSRVKRLELAWADKQGHGQVHVVCAGPGENEAAALKRAAANPADDDFVVCIMKFAAGDPSDAVQKTTEPPPIDSIDVQIEKLKIALRKDGLSGQEIEELLTGGGEA